LVAVVRLRSYASVTELVAGADIFCARFSGPVSVAFAIAAFACADMRHVRDTVTAVWAMASKKRGAHRVTYAVVYITSVSKPV
jgi:hypothetical protein